MPVFPAFLLGAACGIAALALIGWSVLRPARRVWPPRNYSPGHAVAVWALTLGLFGGAAWIGIAQWGEAGWPGWVRFGIGVPLFVAGNLVVWWTAAGFGLAQVSGAVGDLQTDGAYQYSRHPQYIADIAILTGWALWSAAPGVLPVAALGIAALALAPLAEEPWLHATYGTRYAQYCRRVRRYL